MLIKNIVKNVITTNASAPFYYIFVYIQLVILTPLASKLLKSKYRWIGFVISPLILLFNYYCIINNVSLLNVISIVWNVIFLPWFIYYYLGLYMKNIYKKKMNTNGLFILLLLVSIIIQMLEGYWLYKYNISKCGTQLKYSSMITSIIVLLISYNYITKNSELNNTFLTRLMVNIGNCSFGIYLIHILVMQVLIKLLPMYQLIPYGINSIMVLFISFVVVFVVKKVLGNKYSRLVGFA